MPTRAELRAAMIDAYTSYARARVTGDFRSVPFTRSATIIGPRSVHVSGAEAVRRFLADASQRVAAVHIESFTLDVERNGGCVAGRCVVSHGAGGGHQTTLPFLDNVRFNRRGRRYRIAEVRRYLDPSS